MDLSLIFSVIGNILLFLLLILFVILYFTTFAKNSTCCPSTPTPAASPVVPSICLNDPSCNYIIKTIDGKYVVSSRDANNINVVTSDTYNGDTVRFVGSGSNIQIVMSVASDLTNVYFFNLVPQLINKSIVRLTTNQQDKGTIYNLIPYMFSFNNPSGTNLYQIGTPISNSLLGVDSNLCGTREIPITDGFNFFINAPNGLNSKSMFLFIPAVPSIPLIPINPLPVPVTPPSPSPIPVPPTPMPTPPTSMPPMPTPPAPTPTPVTSSSEINDIMGIKSFSSKYRKTKSKSKDGNLILFE